MSCGCLSPDIRAPDMKPARYSCPCGFPSAHARRPGNVRPLANPFIACVRSYLVVCLNAGVVHDDELDDTCVLRVCLNAMVGEGERVCSA